MIETERLRIIPLSYNQLLKYSLLDNSLEQDLQVDASPRSISEALKEALEETILPTVADSSKCYLYSTLWSVISKSENKMVGDLCFVGEPDSKGEIEIGYGTYPEFQKRGYMREAVGAIILWATQQPEVKSIFALTEKDNFASWSVLQHNKFVVFGEEAERMQWRRML